MLKSDANVADMLASFGREGGADLSQDWRNNKVRAPVAIDIKPDAQGRVPLSAVLGDAIGLGAGSQLLDHYRQSKYFSYPSLALMANRYLGKKMLICGGGASMADTLGRVRRLKKLSRNVTICAPNKSHDWLVSKGIIPDFGVMVDPRRHLLGYMTPRKDVAYFLGVSLADEVFEKFIKAQAAFAVFTALNDAAEKEEIVKMHPPERGYSHAFITGGSTVGLRCISLGNMLGHTDFELHGFDSAYKPFADERALLAAYEAAHLGDKKTPLPGFYAYAKPESDYEVEDRTVTFPDGCTFRFFGNNNMTNQAVDFAHLLDKPTFWRGPDGKVLPQRIKVAGDGLIPWMAYKHGFHVDMEAMEKKYGNVRDVDYRCRQPVSKATEAAMQDINRKRLLKVKAAASVTMPFAGLRFDSFNFTPNLTADYTPIGDDYELHP